MTEDIYAEFGAWLKSQREAQGLSLRDIADSTRIPINNLEALENGRRDSLPAPVFVNGFLRSYAREVKLNPDEVVHQYKSLQVQQEPERPEPAPHIPKKPPRQRSGKPRRWMAGAVAVALIAVLIGGVVYIAPKLRAMFQGEPRQTAAQNTASTPSQPAGNVPDDQRREEVEAAFNPPPPSAPETFAPQPSDQPMRPPAPAGAAPQTSYMNPPQSEPAPQPTQPPAPRPAEPMAPVESVEPVEPVQVRDVASEPASVASQESPRPVTQPEEAGVRLYPPPASGHELKLVFDQQSWVQVIIDNQETRHGMYSAGMSETWTAEESILLRVGNAGGVTVIFDGRDLGRLGPEGRVAKIELPRNP